MSRPKPKRSEQEKLIADLLFLRIRQSGRNMRDVSRALGEEEGELSRVLRGFKRLDFGLLYAVLAELRVPREEFFEQLHKLMPFEAEDEDREFLTKPVVAREEALRRAAKLMGSMEAFTAREVEERNAALAAEREAAAKVEQAAAERKKAKLADAESEAGKRSAPAGGKKKSAAPKKGRAKPVEGPKRKNGSH